MVTLYHFQRVWGIPDASPFCVKLETYLRMAGIEYKNDTSFDIRKAPKGKFPLIEHKGEIIADSSLIIDYLKREFGDAVDGHLTDAQRAQGLCLQRVVEDHLYWAGLYFRWVPDESWEQLKPIFFGKLPAPLKWFVPNLVRKQMVAQTKAQGTGRHSDAQILAQAEADLHALSVILGEQPYFPGEKPASIDAVVFGLTANLFYCPLPSPLPAKAAQFSNLRAHCERMKQAYFPDL